MANEWYVQQGGKEHGPLTSAALKKLAQEGKIKPNTSVRLGSDGAWVAASRIQGLFPSTPKTVAGMATVPLTASPPAARQPPKPAAAPVNLAAPPVTPPPAPPRANPLAPVSMAPAARLPKATPAESGSMSAKILGALALILGIVALATCWLPILPGPMGWTGIGAGGLGLLLGIVGFVLSALHKGSGLALGVAGTSSSAVGLVLTIVLGVTFGLFASAPQPPPVVVMPTPLQPPPAIAAPEPAPELAPEPPPEPIVWTDASEAIQLGDVKVRLVSAKIENIRLEGEDLSSMRKQPPKPLVKIRLNLENTSADKIVDFAGWNGGGDLLGSGVGALLGAETAKALKSATATAALTDNVGNNYQQISALQLSAAAALSVGKDNSIRPGKSVATDVVFAPPLATIEFLHLELPGAAFGASEPLRFQIPKAMVAGL